ncbi:MAG: redox-regulated ATPase YchF [Candidatus Latescibacterota bacterium]|nr:redox-regulated ATPase YchF [Candidatus Latescibacterota bacterium]
MSLSTGIVGLPNAGKSTLFNALTRTPVEASNYPFCTIDPNVAVVEVPDLRLLHLSALLSPDSTISTAIQFTDIAGLVRGAANGEGRGNEFLFHIRKTDALLHVIRCFEDASVSHVEEGGLVPVRDAEVVEAELLLSDLEVAERNLAALDKVVKSDPRSSRQVEAEGLRRVQTSLQDGQPVSSVELNDAEEVALRAYQFLSAKSSLFVANVAEKDLPDGGAGAQALQQSFGENRVLVISAQIEAEIAQLDDAEVKRAFLGELGLDRSGLDRLISRTYELLDLITFYTTANGKLQAWQLPAGTTCPVAAGRIHSDMETGFIRAEVAAATDLEEVAGELTRLREQGKLRTEGRDYPIRDGDVVTFLFK